MQVNEEYLQKIEERKREFGIEQLLEGKLPHNMWVCDEGDMMLLEGTYTLFPGFLEGIEDKPGETKVLFNPMIFDPKTKQSIDFEPNPNYSKQPVMYFGKQALCLSDLGGHIKNYDRFVDSGTIVNPLFGCNAEGDALTYILLESQYDSFRDQDYSKTPFSSAILFPRKH